MAKRRKAGEKDVQRDAYLRRRFGIGTRDYLAMLDWQDGRCAICGKEPGAKRFCVDHDHKTSQIRGLLCFRCNYGLPWYSDNPEKLRAAADYITAPPALNAIGYRLAPPKRRRSRRPLGRVRTAGNGSDTGQHQTPADTPEHQSPPETSAPAPLAASPA